MQQTVEVGHDSLDEGFEGFDEGYEEGYENYEQNINGNQYDGLQTIADLNQPVRFFIVLITFFSFFFLNFC